MGDEIAIVVGCGRAHGGQQDNEQGKGEAERLHLILLLSQWRPTVMKIIHWRTDSQYGPRTVPARQLIGGVSLCP
jgi:hypothetical protein